MTIKSLIFFLIISTYPISKKIYIIPPSGYENNKIFDLQDQFLNRDNCIKHFFDLKIALKTLGYNLFTASPNKNLSDGEYILMSGYWTPQTIAHLKKYPKKKLFAHIWEPPTVNEFAYNTINHQIFEKIFIMDDNFIDNKKYIKLHYPHPNLHVKKNIPTFEQRKFCTHISSFNANITNLPSSELYSERVNAIRFFEKNKHSFQFFGKGWNKKIFPSYVGPTKTKFDVLKNYKFCICYENTANVNGYITEKIFDAFEAGCIPIYLGAPNIKKYIPENCFINLRNFKNYQKLLNYLLTIKKDVYNRYIDSIKKYLSSSQAKNFSIDSFISNTILHLNLE